MLSLERLAHEVVTRWERGDLAEAVRALDRHLQEIAEDRERQRGLIERAVGLYADDDIEIDADRTFISESQKGAFVMGWLWVTKREDQCAPLEAHADAVIRPQEGAQPQ
ncbi:hypothetical protein [Variovorax boronicumulans]